MKNKLIKAYFTISEKKKTIVDVLREQMIFYLFSVTLKDKVNSNDHFRSNSHKFNIQ